MQRNERINLYAHRLETLAQVKFSDVEMNEFKELMKRFLATMLNSVAEHGNMKRKDKMRWMGEQLLWEDALKITVWKIKILKGVKMKVKRCIWGKKLIVETIDWIQILLGCFDGKSSECDGEIPGWVLWRGEKEFLLEQKWEIWICKVQSESANKKWKNGGHSKGRGINSQGKSGLFGNMNGNGNMKKNASRVEKWGI